MKVLAELESHDSVKQASNGFATTASESAMEQTPSLNPVVPLCLPQDLQSRSTHQLGEQVPKLNSLSMSPWRKSLKLQRNR